MSQLSQDTLPHPVQKRHWLSSLGGTPKSNMHPVIRTNWVNDATDLGGRQSEEQFWDDNCYGQWVWEERFQSLFLVLSKGHLLLLAVWLDHPVWFIGPGFIIFFSYFLFTVGHSTIHKIILVFVCVHTYAQVCMCVTLELSRV